MPFIDIEGELGPTVMYKPYVYRNIVECSNHFTIFCPHGEIEVRKYIKERNNYMRDPNRIDPFLQDLGAIWKNCCPDWRFGQLIENVFGNMDYVPFMLEEDRMMEEIENYFNVDKDPEFKASLNINKNKKVSRRKKVK